MKQCYLNYKKNELKTTGVYKIENIVNGKIYIGSASSEGGFYRRIKEHINTLVRKKHSNIYLQNSWNKHGDENFKFIILETCDSEKCIEREQYYIDLLKPEYNICPTAGSSLGRKYNNGTIVKFKDWAFRNYSGEKNPSFSGYFKFKNTITNEEVVMYKAELAKYILNNPTASKLRIKRLTSNIIRICQNKNKSIKKWICLGKASKKDRKMYISRLSTPK